MSARVIGFSFVALAGICDLTGAHNAAFYLLLVSVCGIAVAALGAVGEWLEARNQGAPSGSARTVAALWSAALVLAVLGSSARSATLEEHAVSAVGAVSLAASLAVFAIIGAVSWRSRPVRRARTWN